MNKSRQQGVLIFATPLLLALVFIFVTLLIDGSRLLMMQSQMQSVVNSAATAAADEAQACGGTDVTWNAMQQRALLAAQAAGFDGEASDLEILPGVLRPGETATSPMRFASRNPHSEMAQTNATLVRYTRTEPISFLLPQALFPPITVSADAVARKEVYATLSAAGSTATVEDGLLGMLIGSLLGMPGYSLNATDLSSLENTLIGLGDLLAALGVDNLTDLVDEPLLDVLDAVVTLAGGTVTPAGRVVDDLTGALGLSGLNASAVFEVLGDPPSSTNASIPVYDFLISVVMNSVRGLNQGGSGLLALTLDTSDSPLLNNLVGPESPLANLNVSLGLWVNEPPKIVIGPARKDDGGDWMTSVSTGDISLEVLVSMGLAGLDLGVVKVEPLSNLEIPLVLRTGGGQVTLVGAKCAIGDDEMTELQVDAETTALNLESGKINAFTGSVDPENIEGTILKLTDITKLLNIELRIAAGVESVAIKSKYDDSISLDPYPLHCEQGECNIRRTPVSGGQQSIDIELRDVELFNPNSGGLGIFSSAVNELLSLLTPVLTAPVELILNGLITPLLSALGLQVGGMEIHVLGADQTGSQLVENVVFEE